MLRFFFAAIARTDPIDEKKPANPPHSCCHREHGRKTTEYETTAVYPNNQTSERLTGAPDHATPAESEFLDKIFELQAKNTIFETFIINIIIRARCRR